SALNDMAGGEDVAVRSDDGAGAEALLFVFARLELTAKAVTEELPKDGVIDQGIWAITNGDRRVDIDDARSDLFDDGREAGGRLNLPAEGRFLNIEFGGRVGGGSRGRGSGIRNKSGGKRHVECGGKRSAAPLWLIFG